MALEHRLEVPVFAGPFPLWRLLRIACLAGFFYHAALLFSCYPLNQIWILGFDSGWFKEHMQSHYWSIVQGHPSLVSAALFVAGDSLFARLERARKNKQGWIDFVRKTWVMVDFAGTDTTHLADYQKVLIIATGRADQPHDVWLYPEEGASTPRPSKQLNTFGDRWQARQFATIVADLGKLSLAERSEDGVWERKSGQVFLLRGIDSKAADLEMPELLQPPPAGIEFGWSTDPRGFAKVDLADIYTVVKLWGNRLEFEDWSQKSVVFYDELSYIESKGRTVYFGGAHGTFDFSFKGNSGPESAQWFVSLVKYLGGKLDEEA